MNIFRNEHGSYQRIDCFQNTRIITLHRNRISYAHADRKGVCYGTCLTIILF